MDTYQVNYIDHRLQSGSLFQIFFKSFSIADDEFIPSSVGKPKIGSNGHSKVPKKEIEKESKKTPEVLKPVKADDFFANTAPAVKLPKIPRLPKKGLKFFFVF